MQVEMTWKVVLRGAPSRNPGQITSVQFSPRPVPPFPLNGPEPRGQGLVRRSGRSVCHPRLDDRVATVRRRLERTFSLVWVSIVTFTLEYAMTARKRWLRGRDRAVICSFEISPTRKCW